MDAVYTGRFVSWEGCVVIPSPKIVISLYKTYYFVKRTISGVGEISVHKSRQIHSQPHSHPVTFIHFILTGQEAATMNHQSFNPGEASAPVKDGPVITTRKNYSNAKPMPIRHKTENDLVSEMFLFVNKSYLQLGFNLFWALTIKKSTI